MAATNNNDWFGNFLMNVILMILGGLGMYVGWIFVLIGQPDWLYTFITGFGLMPPVVKSFSKVFN